VIALGAISLSNGIKGADFTEIPRPRMIHLSWSLVNFVSCLLAGVAVLSPFISYMLSSTLSEIIPGLTGGALLDPLLAVVVSAIIAVILTIIFYRIALKNARELLRKAEI
jgi:hypothetical protein